MKVKLMERFAPKVEINKNAMNKMIEYVRQSDLEIGWLGTASKNGNTYLIEDVFLFKQEVHATTTEITTEGLNEFAMDLLSKPEGMEIWNKMKVWGHSHVNMTTSPSLQDDNQVKVFSDNAEDFFIRIIANKKGDFRIDLYDYTTGVVYEELPYKINYGKDTEIIESLYRKIEEIKQAIGLRVNASDELINSIKSEISEKVTKKQYEFTTKVDKLGGFSHKDLHCYDYGYSKKNTSVKEEGDRVFQIFDELTDEEKYDIIYYLGSGVQISEYLGVDLTYREELDLEMLLEDFCNENIQEYNNYTGNF